MNYLTEEVISSLNNRGISIEDMAKLMCSIENKRPLTYEECAEAITKVLDKREVCHTILTAIAIDKACEQGLLDKTISEIIRKDEGLYGIDEVMALSIVNVYGSIAFTNFGYLDKLKPGFIGKIDQDKSHCNTFLDDIISAIIASAISKVAHEK